MLVENRSPDGVALPSGDLFLLAFDVAWVPTPQPTDIAFLTNPAPLFINTTNNVVPGDFIAGTVDISQIPTLTPTPSRTPTATATRTPTTTATATVSYTHLDVYKRQP